MDEEFRDIRFRECSGHITIDQEQYIWTVLDKYQEYIGVCNFADIPSMSEYITHDAPSTTAIRIADVDIFHMLR